MTPLKGASSAALLVLGGCHSLVLVDGKLAGDPLEEAALKGIKWELLGNPQDVCRPRPEALVDGVLVLDLPGEGRHVELSQVRILARHHFASKLQCMSVVVTVPALEGGFALVKGSPEALQQMCVDVPAAYTQIAADLAMRGMRVIALGYKRLSPSAVRSCIESRSETEASIHFVGFVAFTCRVRKDSAEIVSQLRAGGCKVIMATGDAILTGIHVAREVGITTESKKSIKLLESAGEGFVWSEYGSNQKESASLEKTSLLEISQRCDLCATGAVLSSALDKVPQLRESLHLFSVLARMRPDEKERVLLALKDCGRCTLMMGDGANDVGALKQAHVGIALLSGFGDLNASKEVESKTPKDKATSSVITATTAVSQNQEDFYNSVVISETDKELCALSLHELHRRMRVIGIEPNDYPTAKDAASLVVIYREKAAEVADEKKELVRRIKYSRMTPAEQKAESAREQKEMAQLKQLEFQQEYERLVAKGESWAIVKAMQAVYKNTNDELKKRREKEGTFEGSAGKMATMMESLDSVEDTSLPMIKIGDASGT
jgi:cation-transporting ATPase 13A1